MSGATDVSNASTELETVKAVSMRIRRSFETVLSASRIPGTTGTCLHASILLQRALDKFADSETVIRGGDGLNDGGARDVTGAWHGHYWVEGVTAMGVPFLADITADQFGWPSVVVLPLAVARERYIPGDDDSCELAIDAEIDRINETLGQAAD
ncbi:hypothetical protein AB4851_08400 [Burkholderia sp. 22PA0099]|uniref:hypothetical protein n=1 Tax=Burkholderia sp. 22PA0099 TaxID=3237372 RepID=UPI0039C299B4